MRARLLLLAAACLLLAGCLEVTQHPPWREGKYNGKKDDLPSQRNFHDDHLAWTATTINRNWLQDEYPRTLHKGADYD